ncbi:MAG TPA: hypothetical protein P5120_12030 [Spirochaetota bacterium]|nr:hypothetical protein [Spirochaetota bacterium]HPR38375.1 hypothetical protein [Spirochaetota bacterium]HRX48239.1 hypothetical protein [Spirochaetota bacterium]
MIKFKTIFAICLCAVLFLSTACTHRLVDFTVISSKNCDVRGKKMQRVKGSDGSCSMIPVNLKEALDRAIEQQPGADALIDGVVYYKIYPFYHKYEVEGTAIATK